MGSRMEMVTSDHVIPPFLSFFLFSRHRVFFSKLRLQHTVRERHLVVKKHEQRDNVAHSGGKMRVELIHLVCLSHPNSRPRLSSSTSLRQKHSDRASFSHEWRNFLMSSSVLMYNLCSCAVLNSTNSLAKSLREGGKRDELKWDKSIFGGLHTVVGRWPPEKIP